MKIALLGYGRMGREVGKMAVQFGHEIAAIFDIDRPLTSDSQLYGAEVLIDFTLKEAVLSNLQTAAHINLPVIEGTTGWAAQLPEVKQIPNLSMVYSPNFSMGMYQFSKLAGFAAQLFGPLRSYDCYLHEWHHNGKADSPSGTAKKLAEVLLTHLPNKQKILTETSQGKIKPEELHVTSTRVGRIPGTHEIGFDSDADFIQLKHTAHGRAGLAEGAIRAAEWIQGKKGIFTMEDFMNSFLQVH